MATDTSSFCTDEFNAILNQMKDDNKAKRRKALEKFNEKVFGNDTVNDSDRLSEILSHSLSSLVPRLSDQSEANRINSCNLILRFIDANVFAEKNLIDIIPVLYHRLGTVPQIEESEDVRLIHINILERLVGCFQAKLIPYMNDIVNILKVTVLDSSPDVKKASCECVASFAIATKDKFHMQSLSLVKPLLKCLTHQRFRNRIACIDALGNIVLFGDSQSIKEIGGPLAQCSMDLPQVRLTLVSLGGKLAKELPDRYSYWHYILPLLLFGLNDDDDDVKNTAMTLWAEVGKKYEMENEDQLKEIVEFDITTCGYPVGEIRPGVGCRSIVYQSLYHILPGLLQDLDDWQAGPRLQSAKLLTTLVLNAEIMITQYAEKVMVALHLAAGDKEENIVKQVVLCSEYLGHFLPPTTYLPLVLPRICNGEKGERPLKILAALIRGSPANLVNAEVTTIVQTISSSDVTYVYDSDHQHALLEVVKITIQKCDVQENVHGLFCTLLFITSSSKCNHVVVDAQELLGDLADKCSISVEELYRQNLSSILTHFQSSADSWLEHTPEFKMFIGLLQFAGKALGSELEHLVNILCACIPKKKDAMVSLRCFTIMKQLLGQEDAPLQSHHQLGKYLPRFVSECIAEFLPWHAGRTAASLRTAALACFVAICKVKGIEKELKEDIKRGLNLIPALIEDESEDTRHLSCDAVCCIKTNYPDLIDSDTFHRLADKIVKRLDDVQAPIRVRAAHLLTILFSNLPEAYDPTLQSARLRDLYERTIIFLDDPDIKLQEAVMNALNEMGKVSPDVLTELLEKDCHKYRNKQYCTKLIDSMKTLSVTA